MIAGAQWFSVVVECVESWGTAWRSKVSCGEAGVWGFGLLHHGISAIYDVCTSEATKTGELREARGAVAVSGASRAQRNTNTKFDDVMAAERQRGRSQIGFSC